MDPAFKFGFWLLALSAIAAFTDLRGGRIPNWLTLPSMVAAPLVHGLAAGPGALGESLWGAVAAAVVPLLMFRGGGLGGGDLKLFCALGAIGGAGFGVGVELVAFSFALLFALCRLTYRGRLWATLAGALRLLGSRLWARRAVAPPPEALESIALGPAIFAASAALTLGGALP